MNAFINWLNKHIVPVAAKIGSVRWLIALRDAFIAIMPAMYDGRCGRECFKCFDP